MGTSSGIGVADFFREGLRSPIRRSGWKGNQVRMVVDGILFLLHAVSAPGMGTVIGLSI